DVLSVGDKVKVKVIKIDDLNRINLSMKAVSEE
ncbi:MAG: S1 RNA-binding domain-containing protein, partial [Candidatus Muiribacteriota bacterium]